MSDGNIAAKKATDLHAWFAAGGNGEYEVASYDSNVVRYDILDANWYSKGSISLRDFVGGLLYHDAVRLEQETGYCVNASLLAEQVSIAFVCQQEAA